MSDTIHGFYFDQQMYRDGESPKEGDWPNLAAFSWFVHESADVAIEHVKQQENIMAEAGRKTAEKLNEIVMNALVGKGVPNNGLQPTPKGAAENSLFN